MITQYRIYDRYDLSYIDGGIVKDYVVDMDYLTNNTSTVTLTEQCYGNKGDILVCMQGLNKLFMGVITAVDNTKKTISIKHMKELFNDNIINIFKFTNLLDYKFNAIQGLHDILKASFLDIDDPKRRLPLILKARDNDEISVYSDDSSTINLLDFIAKMFDNHNIYLDFDIDFLENKIVCNIIKNTRFGVVIKDNLLLSEPTFDKNELPSTNKAIVYDNETGTIKGTFYLLTDNTITTDSSNKNRLLPAQTKYLEFSNDKGYTALELAKAELAGNIFNHCVQYKLSKEQNLVKPLDFNIGDKVKIIYSEREYDSIFTGLKFNSTDPYYTCFFGKTRIDFTDRLKQYLEKKYRKK